MTDNLSSNSFTNHLFGKHQSLMVDNITTHNNTVHSSEKKPNSEVDNITTQHKPLIRKTPNSDGGQFIKL